MANELHESVIPSVNGIVLNEENFRGIYKANPINKAKKDGALLSPQNNVRIMVSSHSRKKIFLNSMCVALSSNGLPRAMAIASTSVKCTFLLCRCYNATNAMPH